MLPAFVIKADNFLTCFEVCSTCRLSLFVIVFKLTRSAILATVVLTLVYSFEITFVCIMVDLPRLVPIAYSTCSSQHSTLLVSEITWGSLTNELRWAWPPAVFNICARRTLWARSITGTMCGAPINEQGTGLRERFAHFRCMIIFSFLLMLDNWHQKIRMVCLFP